jgi:hypothetical protein
MWHSWEIMGNAWIARGRHTSQGGSHANLGSLDDATPGQPHPARRRRRRFSIKQHRPPSSSPEAPTSCYHAPLGSRTSEIPPATVLRQPRMLLTPRTYALAQVPDNNCRKPRPSFFLLSPSRKEFLQEEQRARKMLLLHQTGSVKVGEVVR